MKQTASIFIFMLFASTIFAQQASISSPGEIHIPLPISWTSSSSVGEIHIFFDEPVVDTTPPVIVLSGKLRHSQNIKVGKKQFTISGKATDASGVSNVFLGGDAKDYSDGMNFSFTVNLKKGVNSFTLKAKDIFSNSTTKEITVNYKPERRDIALLFYVSNYSQSTLPNLHGTKKNANALEKILSKNYGFETHVYPNYTRNQIRVILAKYQEKEYSSGDQLLIYFSGHGSNQYGGLLLCAKNTDISHADFTKLSVNKCQHTMLIIDACYGGLLAYMIGSNPVKYKPSREEYISELLKITPARKAFTSGEGVGSIQNDGLSIFTEALIKVLETKKGKYYNILTDSELHGFLKTEYNDLKPGFFDKSDNSESRFLFIRK